MAVNVTTEPNSFGIVLGNQIETGDANSFPSLQPNLGVLADVSTNKPGLVELIGSVVLAGLDFHWVLFDFFQVFLHVKG